MNRYTDGYFLCVPCAGGYHSYYNEFYDPNTAKHVYIIKGANSVCTPRILSAVEKEAKARALPTEKIYSPLSPTLPEALALPTLGVFLLDGNYPRTVHQKYPIASETLINADDLLDRDYPIRNAGAIRLAADSAAEEQRRCMNYLTAVRSVYSDSFALMSACVDREKICRYAARFAAREFPIGGSTKSNVENRFLSAITPYGIWTNYQTVSQMRRIIAIDDSTGYAASVLIHALKKEAEERGLACTVCHCQTNPDGKAEHILIPEADLAFFTANSFHPAPKDTERVIHMTRFIDRTKASDCRFRINFNKKAAKELLAQAVKAEATAKDMLDIMDSYYEAAVNEEALQARIAQLPAEIFG